MVAGYAKHNLFTSNQQTPTKSLEETTLNYTNTPSPHKTPIPTATPTPKPSPTPTPTPTKYSLPIGDLTIDEIVKYVDDASKIDEMIPSQVGEYTENAYWVGY